MTPALYNSVNLCKSAGYMKCKRNKWDFEEELVGRSFQKGKVRFARLDGHKTGKVESCSEIKDGIGRIWKKYFEGLYM